MALRPVLKPFFNGSSGGAGGGVTKTLSELQTYLAASHVGQVIKITDRAEAPNTFTWAYSSGNTWKSVYTGVVVSTDPIIPQSISVSPKPVAGVIGQTLQLVTTILPSGASQVANYLSSDPSVVSVSATGLLSFNATGTASVSATTANGLLTDGTSVSVTVAPVKQLRAVTTWNLAHDSTYTVPAGKRTIYMAMKTVTGSGEVDGLDPAFLLRIFRYDNTGMSEPLGNDMNVLEASVQSSTTSAPMNKGGSRSYNMPDGQWSNLDHIPPQNLGFSNGKIPVGTVLWTKFKALVPEGGKIPHNLRNPYGQANVFGWVYDSSATTVPSVDVLGIAGYTNTAPVQIDSPIGPFMFGTFVDPATKAFCIIGDSIAAGQGDDNTFGNAGMGYAPRALGKFDVPMASINLGVPGSTSSSLLADPYVDQMMKMGPDGLIVNFGTNDDIYGLVTPAQAIANIKQQIARYKGLPGIRAGVLAAVAKILVRAYDATQAYVTDGTQQVSPGFGAGEFVDIFNAMVNTTNFDAVLPHDIVRSPTDVHKWSGVNGKVTVDGTHLNGNGNNLVSIDDAPILKSLFMDDFVGKSMSANFLTGTYTAGKPATSTTLAALANNTRAGTTSTYYGTDGLLKVAAANSLRIDSQGLVVEKTSTNLVPVAHPGLYTTAGSGVTGTPNGATGLDGAQSAWLSALDSVASQQNVGINADDNITIIDIIVRPETPGTGRFYMPGTGMYYKFNNADDASSFYDFATKSFGGGCNGNWRAEEFTAAGFTWTKLTYRVWNDTSGSLVILKFQNNTFNRCIVGNVYVGREAYALTPVIAGTGTKVRPADAILIPSSTWASGKSSYLVVDADDTVNVSLGSAGVTITGWGHVRSIEHWIGTKPDNKQLGGLVMMNLSAAGFGASNVTAQWPGVLGNDYEYPAKSYFDRWKAEGMTGIRLPIEWTRVQKTLSGALDSAEVAAITACLDIAAANGQRIVIDLHDYFQRWMPNGDGTNTAYIVGSPQVPESALLNVWSRIVTQFKNHPGLLGWCFMNEPPGTEGAWAVTAQKLIDQTDALEAATATPRNFKFINGDGYSGTANWYQQNQKYFPLKGKNLVYEGHFYFDSTNQGLYNDLGEIVELTRGTSRVAPWIKWLEAYNVAGYIGEVGWPATMSTQSATDAMNAAAASVLSMLASKNIPITYFAGGPRWNETHPLTIEYNGVVRGQINQLRAVQKTISKYGPAIDPA